MATHSSIPAWKIPWTGAWRATVHGAAKAEHDWAWLNMTRKARPRAAEALTPSCKKRHTQPRAGTQSERLHC